MGAIEETSSQLREYRRELERRGHDLRNGAVDLVSAMIADYPDGFIVEPELATTAYNHLLVDDLRAVITPAYDATHHYYQLTAVMEKGTPFIHLELKDRRTRAENFVVSIELLTIGFNAIEVAVRGEDGVLPEESIKWVKTIGARLHREDGNIGCMKQENLRLGESILRYATAAYRRMASSEMGK